MKQDELKEYQSPSYQSMSVADGYNAIIRGVVTFYRNPSDSQIRDAINNLFLKYAEVEIEAINKLGHYEGKIDHASHPEVRKFLKISENPGQEHDNAIATKYYHIIATRRSLNHYYFELRCAHIKILNREKIQYARFQPDETIKIKVRKFEWSSAFRRIYGVARVFIDDIEIEELGTVPIKDVLNFL